MPVQSDENKRKQVQDSFNNYSGLDNLKSAVGLNSDPMTQAISQRRQKINNAVGNEEDENIASE